MAAKTPIITDISLVEDEAEREALAQLAQLSNTLLADRAVEAKAAAAKDATWKQIQEAVRQIGTDVAFESEGVKLTYSPATTVEVQVPDIEKISEVQPKLIEYRDRLAALLASVEEKIAEQGKTHFRVEQKPVKEKLTVNAKATKKAAAARSMPARKAA